MTIRMNDFRAESSELRAAQAQAMAAVVDSGHYILGPQVERFEHEWAAFCEAPFAIGVASGLDAIEIGLRAAGVGPGDEIITTPVSAFATALAIIKTGAKPVFADIDLDTGLLALDSVRNAINRQTKGVLLVHLYGAMAPVDEYAHLCDEAGIMLFEDCAQSHGARWLGRSCGTFGEFGAFSFYPTKNLGALGDGGALICRSEELAERARSLRNYGQEQRYVHVELGMNSRLDELQAAILTARLGFLQQQNVRRAEIARRYRAGIQQTAVQPLAAPKYPESHSHHLYVMRVRGDRGAFLAHLAAHGVSADVHYPVPIHRQPAITENFKAVFDLPAAQEFCATCVSLPCHPNLSDADCEKVIAAVNAFKP